MGISAASRSRSAAARAGSPCWKRYCRNEESAADLRAEIAAGQQDSTEAAAALERHRAVAKSMELAGRKLAAELDALNDELVRLTRETTRAVPAGIPCGARWRP